jgi:hypothetical protein
MNYTRHQLDTNLRPTIESIRVVIKNNLQNSAGSSKTTIPTRTVPTAPTPVHTAYAVPIGNVCVALYKRNMLIERQIAKPSHHNEEVNP